MIVVMIDALIAFRYKIRPLGLLHHNFIRPCGLKHHIDLAYLFFSHHGRVVNCLVERLVKPYALILLTWLHLELINNMFQMSKFEPSDYAALNLSGDNYLEWVMNTSVALKSRGLGKCIIDGNNAIESEKHRAITIMRYHLTEDLRDQYLNIEDPCDLWTKLNSRYSMALWRKAMNDWKILRFQDFESVDEYNSALMKIAYSLELCGEVVTNEDLLYKTYSTFHPKDLLLSHKAKGFTTYNDLLSCLLATEQREQKVIDTISRFEKLQKRYIEQQNSEMRPPEANEAKNDKEESKEAVWKYMDCEAGLYID